MKDGILEHAMDAFKIESESLIKTMEAIDPAQFAAVVDALSKAERIAAAGCGHSGIACQHFAHLMCCIDRPARFISPAEAVHGATGFLQKGEKLPFAGSNMRIEAPRKGDLPLSDAPNGYAAILADGCTLGGVKAVGGVAKNHYPKGLRKR